MKRTTIMLRSDQLKALAELRKKTGISMGEAIRRAIDAALYNKK